MSLNDQVERIFAEAVALEPSQRQSLVNEACAGDENLRREVLELLQFDLPSTSAALPFGEQSTRPDRKRLSAQPQADNAMPRTVGRYAIERMLGEGGMGIVYLGSDDQLSRKVAIKVLKGATSASARVRLMREAQAMARIRHPNVAHVYEVGTQQNDLFVAMEHIEGESLSEWLRQPRRTTEVLELFLQAGRGLAAAHKAGVLHRDFKPQNVLVGSDGRACVLDFGLAREALVGEGPDPPARPTTALSTELTHAGTVMGTPGYMSPEHFVGGVSPASDQWSFAAALYQALYQTRPYPEVDLGALEEAVLTRAPRAVPSSDVPHEIEQAVLRALSRYPEDRFASMQELIERIEEEVRRDPEQDSSRLVRQRRVAVMVIGGLVASNFLAAGVRTQFRYDLTLGGTLVQSTLGIAMIAGAFALYRKTAFETRHNRRLLGLFALLMATMSLHRLYGMARSLDVLDVLRLDAMTACGLMLFGAVTLERWLLAGAMIFAGYLALSLLWPAASVAAFGLALFAVTVLSITSWPADRPKGRRSRLGRGTGADGSTRPS